MVGSLFWSAVAMPVLAGVGLSFLLEYLLQPKVAPFWQRPLSANTIHIGIWLLFFGVELAVFRRPWFAMANVLAFMFFVVLVSNAKYHFLREPFIFQDFEYFTDALRHPRLYLPFLGARKAMLAVAVFGLVLYSGMKMEPSLIGHMPIAEFFSGLIFMVLFALVMLWESSKKKLTVAFEPAMDLCNLGLMTSLWRYGEEENDLCSIPPVCSLIRPSQSFFGTLPLLVVVQSESFFDARGLFAGVRSEVLRKFDEIKASAVCQGQVEVPAWGANTVRSEFSFLSGLGSEVLGVHRFNPYRKLARQGIPTLASFLKQLGYRTVCVHPYPASFYGRDKVYPFLGFDEFIDIRNFNDLQKTGPYVGDVALAEKVCSLLQEASAEPIFVFVITMENHGPLHLEKVLSDDEERLYSTKPPEGCDDLTVYLRHLANADRMAGMLREQLEALPGAAWLCWFGDHVPIMPKVYEVMGMPNGKTDYLIWRKGGRSVDSAFRQDLKIESLSSILLQKMGLAGILEPLQAQNVSTLKNRDKP